MANKTANYGLTKPTQEEFYDVSVQNTNMDIIDGKLKSADNRLNNVDTKLNELETSVENVGKKVDDLEVDAGNLTGTLPVEHGGTGATNANDALNKLGAVPKSTFDSFKNNTDQHIANKQNPHGVTAEQVGLVPLAELPNLYVWKKYDNNPSYVESDIGEKALASGSGGNFTISYADEISVSNGVISLVNSKTCSVVNYSTSSVTVLRGKYVKNATINSILYVHPSASISVTRGDYLDTLKASEAVEITAGERTPLGFVASNEIGEYPNNGKHTDGYWYKYQSKFGENPYPYTYGTEDMIASESALETGKLYFVYE